MSSSPTSIILLTSLYKVLFPLFWTPARGIYYHHPCYWSNIYRQNGWVVYVAGLRHQSRLWLGFKSNSCHFIDIPKESIVSCILNTCTLYHLPLSMLMTTKYTSKTAELSKVLVYGTSHFCGVGWVPLQSFYWHSYTKSCFLYFGLLHMVFPTIIHAIDQQYTGKMAEWSMSLA